MFSHSFSSLLRKQYDDLIYSLKAECGMESPHFSVGQVP